MRTGIERIQELYPGEDGLFHAHNQSPNINWGLVARRNPLGLPRAHTSYWIGEERLAAVPSFGTASTAFSDDIWGIRSGAIVLYKLMRTSCNTGDIVGGFFGSRYVAEWYSKYLELDYNSKIEYKDVPKVLWQLLRTTVGIYKYPDSPIIQGMYPKSLIEAAVQLSLIERPRAQDVTRLVDSIH